MLLELLPFLKPYVHTHTHTHIQSQNALRCKNCKLEFSYIPNTETLDDKDKYLLINKYLFKVRDECKYVLIRKEYANAKPLKNHILDMISIESATNSIYKNKNVYHPTNLMHYETDHFSRYQTRTHFIAISYAV